MNIERLSRITDLFLEGKELHFGDDADGSPVVVWVNKLNSFEDEEARRDGAAARSLRVLGLSDDNPEIKNAREELGEFGKDELIQIVAAQSFDEDYLLAIDDVESEPEWVENLGVLRMGTLLEDADIAEDDARVKQVNELNAKYMTAIQTSTDKRQKDRRIEYADLPSEDLCDLFIKNWKNRVGMADFLAEQRVTQIFYSLRDCQGVRKGGGWDHSGCKHIRLLSERSQVRSLPEDVLERAVEVITELRMDSRTAGNSGVPANSSESSGRPKLEEESTPSTPEVTSPNVHAI